MSQTPHRYRQHLATSYERAAAIAAQCIRDGTGVSAAIKDNGLFMSPDAKNWGQFIMQLANHIHRKERDIPDNC